MPSVGIRITPDTDTITVGQFADFSTTVTYANGTAVTALQNYVTFSVTPPQVRFLNFGSGAATECDGRLHEFGMPRHLPHNLSRTHRVADAKHAISIHWERLTQDIDQRSTVHLVRKRLTGCYHEPSSLHPQIDSATRAIGVEEHILAAARAVE